LLSTVKIKALVLHSTLVIPANAGTHFDLCAISTSGLLGVSELPACQGSESRRESIHGGLAAVPTARDGGSVDYAGAIIDLFQTLSPPCQAVRSTSSGVRLGLLSKVKSKALVLAPTLVIPANAGTHFDLCAVSTSGLLGVSELPARQGSERRRESVHGGLAKTSLF